MDVCAAQQTLLNQVKLHLQCRLQSTKYPSISEVSAECRQSINRHVHRQSDNQLSNILVNMPTNTRPINLSIDISRSRYWLRVGRDVDQYIDPGVHKLHRIRLDLDSCFPLPVAWVQNCHITLPPSTVPQKSESTQKYDIHLAICSKKKKNTAL